MTTAARAWPSWVDITFKKKNGQVALDQIRAVDKSRLVKKIGTTPEKTATKILEILQEIFI